MLDLEQTVVVAFVLGLVYYIRSKRNKSQYSQLPLPPGPKRLPILGNILDRPKAFDWETYHRWCQELDTDILYLNYIGTNVVVLDTNEAAYNLLERRSSMYSARSRMTMVNELMGWDFGLGFMNYGERWRTHRRLMHLSFHPAAALKYRPQLLRSTRNLLNRFLDFPDDYVITNVRHMAGETIMSVAYGIEVQPKDDPYIKVAEENMRVGAIAAVPGAFLVDNLPFLKYVPDWFPGADFKRKAKEWKELAQLLIYPPFDVVKRNIATGSAPPSFVANAFEKARAGYQDASYREDVIRDVSASLYAAGSDTTVNAIAVCILGLLDHPEVLKNAQAEIDQVVKPGYLPDFEDEPNLPYITAIVKESLRWMTILPIAIPHYVEVEDEYKGYRIPASSIIIPNSWAMLHDEDAYPDPYSFNPERFMKGGQLDKDVRDPAHACWGFGRRICPGRFMAFSSIWITIASMIAAFDIKKTIDAKGNVIEPSHECVSALLCAPRPFKCSIKPRSKETEHLIRASAAQEAF